MRYYFSASAFVAILEACSRRISRLVSLPLPLVFGRALLDCGGCRGCVTLNPRPELTAWSGRRLKAAFGPRVCLKEDTFSGRVIGKGLRVPLGWSYQSTSLSCSFLARWPLRLLLDLSGRA